jgi:hypothetical protein
MKCAQYFTSAHLGTGTAHATDTNRSLIEGKRFKLLTLGVDSTQSKKKHNWQKLKPPGLAPGALRLSLRLARAGIQRPS